MRYQLEILQDINTIKEKKLDVYIFGAGKIGITMGKELINILDLEIKGYCDTNYEKWGIEVEKGIFCLSPEQITAISNKCCFLMLGQYHKESGLEVVRQLGFDIIIDYDELCSLDIIVEKVIGKTNDTSIRDYFRDKTDFLESHLDGKEYVVLNPNQKKIAIYTCISGNYDEVTEPENISDICDYYLISDEKPDDLKVFQWIDLKDVVPQWIKDNPRKNRYCKINGATIFSNYKYSIYIDGNIKIVGDISDYINKIGTVGFATHIHAYNNCLYAEAIKVIAALNEDKEMVKTQVREYRESGMPREYGQFQNGILVRENNNLICKKLMQAWWKEVFVKSHRDQLSLSYCLWKNNIDISQVGILGDNIRKNKDFVWVKRHHI